jgi:peroxiredoxin
MGITRRGALIGGGAAAAGLTFGPQASAQAPPPGSPDDPRPRSYRMLGQAAPAFDFPGLDGRRARLSDYRGRVLVLYFWGLWCPDCIADGANVNQLAQNIGREQGISFLGIHTRGRFGRWGSVPRYFEETGYNYPVAFDEGRTFARDTYLIEWFPSFLAIDGAGVIRHWRTDLGAQGAGQFLAQARALRR